MTTPLPLTHIEIDGFRGLRRLALGPLSRVNVLVGGNNSGKTSVLEAISILAKPTQPAAWIDMIRWRDPGGMDESRCTPCAGAFPARQSLSLSQTN